VESEPLEQLWGPLLRAWARHFARTGASSARTFARSCSCSCSSIQTSCPPPASASSQGPPWTSPYHPPWVLLSGAWCRIDCFPPNLQQQLLLEFAKPIHTKYNTLNYNTNECFLRKQSKLCNAHSASPAQAIRAESAVVGASSRHGLGWERYVTKEALLIREMKNIRC